MYDDPMIEWLLEDANPAVRHRTLAELLRADARERCSARDALRAGLVQLTDASWQAELSGLRLAYHLTAIAECALTKADVDVTLAVDRYLDAACDAACADALGLRALVMLGYGDDERVHAQLDVLAASQLPDGGFLCLHRLRGMGRTPKSCYKDDALMLLLYAECAKRGVPVRGASALVDYFRRHRMFYRTDGTELVLGGRVGWRSIDTFHPFEAMRVGVHNIVESMSALGQGGIDEMREAWAILEGKRRGDGYVLDGTLTRSYLPKERVGAASKWVTLYALLARRYADGDMPRARHRP